MSEIEDRLLELALEESSRGQALPALDPASLRHRPRPGADDAEDPPSPPTRGTYLAAALLLFGLAIWWGVHELSQAPQGPQPAGQHPASDVPPPPPRPVEIGTSPGGTIRLKDLSADAAAIRLPLCEPGQVPSENQLQRLDGLRRFAKLRYLWLHLPLGTRRHANLPQDSVVLSEALCRRLRDLPSLEYLRLPPWCTLSRRALQELAKLPRLHTFWLNSEGIAAADLRVLAEFPQLRHLHVHIELGDGRHLAALAKAQRLLSVSLRKNRSMTSEDLLQLAPLRRLRYLDLSDCNGLSTFSDRRPSPRPTRGGIDDRGLAALAGMKDLRWLSLANCQRVRGPGLAALTGLTGLRYLDLQNTEASRENLQALPTGLEELRAHAVPLDGPALSRLTRLQRLVLSWCTKFSDRDLAALENLPLTDLDLTYCKALTAGCIDTLRRLKQLRRLNLFGAKWTNDAALAGLAHLDQLEALNLGGLQPYGDPGLRALRQLKRLDELGLQANKQITTAGLRELLEGGAPLRKLNIYLSPGIDPQALADLLADREVRGPGR